MQQQIENYVNNTLLFLDIKKFEERSPNMDISIEYFDMNINFINVGISL